MYMPKTKKGFLQLHRFLSEVHTTTVCTSLQYNSCLICCCKLTIISSIYLLLDSPTSTLVASVELRVTGKAGPAAAHKLLALALVSLLPCWALRQHPKGSIHNHWDIRHSSLW